MLILAASTTFEQRQRPEVHGKDHVAPEPYEFLHSLYLGHHFLSAPHHSSSDRCCNRQFLMSFFFSFVEKEPLITACTYRYVPDILYYLLTRCARCVSKQTDVVKAAGDRLKNGINTILFLGVGRSPARLQERRKASTRRPTAWLPSVLLLHTALLLLLLLVHCCCRCCGSCRCCREQRAAEEVRSRRRCI